MDVRRFVAPFFAIAGVALLPWTVWLTYALPAHHETNDWRIVWMGFDLALVVALFSTAFAAVRRSGWLEAVAAVCGTLLCTDAWFDVTLEVGGRHLVAAILQAALAELPLAAICFWIAVDAERKLVRTLPRSG